LQGRVCESAIKKEKAAEEGGTRRGRIQLEQYGPRVLYLGITRRNVTKPILYLCDNQLKANKIQSGEGGKATLAGAPDAVADILLEAMRQTPWQTLLEAIEELRKRTTAGAATFLVKVKVHRGEPANKEADMQADKAISNKDVPMEWQLWDDGTNQAVLTWHEPRRKGSTVS